ncbi:hypothetical protein CGGC5_v002654 [Colletotrichum fructicola Nara gc5]|uniref:Uncharacterized protein n=1 Tax=Colletotrichum fructicola (strain Nara gc5) TaxID=1213859 RepID=A0A7J6JRE1_COLFN|nr:hypothetical protein CGGC5_v002654 [Colletotrichum fructicola Nara gc5]
MKKLSVKESTSVFGRPSECGDRRRTRGEGGLRKGAKPTISHRRNKAPGRKGGQKKIPSIVKGTSMKTPHPRPHHNMQQSPAGVTIRP